MIKLPIPHYYVLYNRDKECDDVLELRLSEYLLLHKAKVLDMVLTEYNEEKTLKLFAKEYEEIGEERGKQKEKIKIAKKMLEENVVMPIICSCTGLTEKEVEELR